MNLIEQITKRVEQQERIVKAKAEKERRKNILIKRGHYIEDFNETILDKNGKIKTKKTRLF
jgi:hypothetical protein